MIDSKIVNTINPNRTEFPKLMISCKNTIVLFEAEYTGVVVLQGQADQYIGDYSENWNMNIFTNFNGKVELSNA